MRTEHLVCVEATHMSQNGLLFGAAQRDRADRRRVMGFELVTNLLVRYRMRFCRDALRSPSVESLPLDARAPNATAA